MYIDRVHRGQAGEFWFSATQVAFNILSQHTLACNYMHHMMGSFIPE